MRVALIAPPWLPVPPPAYGGTEAILDTLARGLARAGHDVLLVTTGDSTCPVERCWVYPEARTAEMGDAAVELRHVLNAYEVVTDADIVHDHTTAGPTLGSLLPGHRVVTTNHGRFNAHAKAIFESIADRVPIVAISNHQASTAGDVPIARVIHHGLDLDQYPLGDGAGQHLVFLGRMSPDKGVREAIEIARRAGVPLLIAAKMQEKGERRYFEEEIKPRLGKGAEYVGEVGGADKVKLLGDALALVNPIRWDEPFGLCMIEALACGTPILSTPRGAAPEIVHPRATGYLCTNLDAMVHAVGQAASLDRGRCRAVVASRFSMERMARDHIALYEGMLTGRVPVPAGSGVAGSGAPAPAP